MLYALYYPQIAISTREASESEQDSDASSISFPVQIFHYTIERMRHVQGEWRSITAPLFPDYIFFNCENNDVAAEVKEELEADLNKREKYNQQLPLIPIPDELSGLLDDISDTRHHIRMSKGVITGGLAHVTEGPLIGQDNRIVRIDRHKRLAWLKVSDSISLNFAKDSTNVVVAGLEITERLL